MRRIRFIQKLVKEKKIQIVEPSNEIHSSYKIKSINSLKAAKILMKENLIEEAISMNYYAIYNNAISLLILIGIKCENHDATIIILKELFKINTTTFENAKKERIEQQYYTNQELKIAEAKELIKNSEEFINEIDFFIESLTQDDKNNLLIEFKNNYF